MIDAEQLASTPPEEMAAKMIRLRREIDALELRLSQLATAFAQTAYGEYESFNTATDWVRGWRRVRRKGATP